jgi:aryl-alcohol dehydrogenase-like predicted oxidoreductase
MEYISRNGYEFSKLALGTVQLGMDYGISNRNGKPSSMIAKDIIDSALQAGITTLDTSESYGSAEKEIGTCLANYKGRNQPVVVTKFKVSVQSSYSNENIREEIYKSIDTSLRRLNLRKVPVYLFHKDKNQRLEQLIEPLLNVFDELKRKEMIEIAGISAYGPEDVDTVLNNDILEAVQIPINIFDHRLVKNGRLDQLTQQNKIVFARSIFLQGLLFMKADEVPGKLLEAKKYLSVLGEIATTAGLTIPQLAFKYVNNMQAITSIVFGAISTQQVIENISLLELPALEPGITESISQAFANVPDLVITPGLW